MTYESASKAMSLIGIRIKRLLRRLSRGLKQIWVFSNWNDFERARRLHDDGETVLRTRSGLKIAVRHNRWDAVIVQEQFLDQDYVRCFRAPAGRPSVIVDVGSYIGDFALWSAHELGARVIAYEPTAENFAMLTKNLQLNPHLIGRVTAVNRGVSADKYVKANVQVIGREIHASSEMYADDESAESRTFKCDTLAEILDKHGIDTVDLLKVDCEGGEYSIFSSTSVATYDRIQSIVYEWHQTNDWMQKLEAMELTLRTAGFEVVRSGQIGYATRPEGRRSI